MSLVYIVRYVSECDVEPVGEPMEREDAMAFLAEMPELLRQRYDLVYVETGRFASWVIA